MRIISIGLAIVGLLSLAALAEVYIRAEDALRNIFGAFEEYRVDEHILDNQEVKVFTVFKNREVDGWAVVSSEMGKIKPITFLVGIDIRGKVKGVYVLEYRDMFGSEIKRSSFLKQFQGKSLKDRLQVGRDIDAVTGATISSKAATSAVRKSLRAVEELRK